MSISYRKSNLIISIHYVENGKCQALRLKMMLNYSVRDLEQVNN
jgi:hypothetical protein